MIEFGYDIAEAPSVEQIDADLKTINGTFCFVYVGGPDSGGSGYTPELVKSWGKPFCPIFVPRQSNFTDGAGDGAAAASLAAAYGAKTIALDCEQGSYQAGGRAGWSYVQEIITVLHTRGIKVVIYSGMDVLTAMINNGGVEADWLWIAEWPNTRPTPNEIQFVPETINGHSSINVPGFRQIRVPVAGWQYGQETVNGRTVDLDAVNPIILTQPETHQATTTPAPAATTTPAATTPAHVAPTGAAALPSDAVTKARIGSLRGGIQLHLDAIDKLMTELAAVEATL